MSLSEDVDLEEFILAKDDMSGADIKAVCTEAGLLALRERRMRVTKKDFTSAREKVGPTLLLILLLADENISKGSIQEKRRYPWGVVPIDFFAALYGSFSSEWLYMLILRIT